MASFGPVSFTVDVDAYEEKREARVAIQEIPGGDTFYVDRAGRRPLFWSFGILLANFGGWAALNSLIGTSATLSIELNDSHTATLMSLSRPGPQVDGQTRASAEFLITSA